MSKLTGKVAIVTGAGSGIGQATAELFAREGARVVVADIAPDRAERVAAQVEADGGQALPVRVDVSDEAQVEAMVGAAVRQFGRLDVLHNNAALTDVPTQRADTTVVEMTAELWDRVFAVNARGPMLGCKHAIPAMMEGGGGSIINTSSGAAKRGDLVRTAYGSSKGAVDALTLYVATQFGRHRIRCNAIAPGMVTSPAADANVDPETRRILRASVLLPDAGRPVDVAELALFLASDDSSYITGQILAVNGGSDAHSPTYAQLIG